MKSENNRNKSDKPKKLKQLAIDVTVRYKIDQTLTRFTFGALPAEVTMFSIESLHWYYQLPLVAGFCTLLWATLKLWRSIRERQIGIIPSTWNGVHGHQWSLIQCLTHRATCCLCQSLIVDAMFCYSCGVCLDFACYQQLTSYFPSRTTVNHRTLSNCKAASVPACKEEMAHWKHHWVEGNLPAHSRCFICDDYCDEDQDDDGGDASDFCSAQTAQASKHISPRACGDDTLYHYRCCWCQRAVHERCYHRNTHLTSDESVVCDFGSYRRYILPPYCVIHRKAWTSKGRRAIQLEQIRDIGLPPDWQPILVIANRKSGNADADRVLQQFLPVLNPIQVIDTSQQSIEFGLQIVKMIKRVAVRIVVAGGDGTIGWVLNTIQQMQLDPVPLVAVVPLGTGNDLSRVLGWGDGSGEYLDRDHLLQLICKARPIELDRWNLEIRPSGYYHRSRRALISSLHIPRSIMPTGYRNVYVYNYFSIGVDALVALNFHMARKSKLYNLMFTNTLINKFLYFTYGTKDLLERRCKNLHNKVCLELDGQVVELPELESIVLLNIPSWGGGVKLLAEGEHRYDDALIEVLGLTSSFHIGQVMIGLSSPIKLGQASVVRLTLAEHLPVQIDGEPWIEAPATIELSWHSRARLLKCTS